MLRGFLLKGKTYTPLTVPGSTGTVATGINNKGDIVLYWYDSSGTLNSSIYDGKTYKPINVPGAMGSLVVDINNEGDTLYQWLDSAGLFHGALFHNRKYYKFDTPKAYQTFAGGINDKQTFAAGSPTQKNGPVSSFRVTFK